ncbi:MAG TPA: hypothetical protein VK453_25225 [Micromonosporaceae bacterium]|nr:hypothetical protein [Micromonosporaceae bacterium]
MTATTLALAATTLMVLGGALLFGHPLPIAAADLLAAYTAMHIAQELLHNYQPNNWALIAAAVAGIFLMVAVKGPVEIAVARYHAKHPVDALVSARHRKTSRWSA